MQSLPIVEATEPQRAGAEQAVQRLIDLTKQRQRSTMGQTAPPRMPGIRPYEAAV